MNANPPWLIRPFSPETDQEGLLKLGRDVAGFDGTLSARTPEQLAALLAHPTGRNGKTWKAAISNNGALVGAMEVYFTGTRRTQLILGVNPAWRRQGIGAALLAEVPAERRLLTRSRASQPGASALLEGAGFRERHRDLRMRRRSIEFEALPLPRWARIEEDRGLDPERFRTASLIVTGEDAETDLDLIRARLRRGGMRVLYLTTPEGDQGLCVIGPSQFCRKPELDAEGNPTIGCIEEIGLAKSCRGKGVSQPMVRAGLRALIEGRYRELEVLAKGKRPRAATLYRQEGFEEVDADIEWIRRDDTNLTE